MASDKAKEILKRFRKARGRKTNWNELYEDAMTYAAPQREQFHDEEMVGEDRMKTGVVFDSTGINALQKFASNIQSSFTPTLRKWVELAPGSQVEDDSRTREQLEQITEVMFSAIQNSNFDTQIAESYIDLGVGTGALLVQRGDSSETPLRFTNIPLHQLFLEEGPNGSINTAFRQHKIALRNIEDTWSDAELGSEVEKMREEDPDKKLNFIEATVPSRVELFNPRTEQMEETDGFRYMVIVQKTEEVIVEREQRSSPWVIFRWSSLPGEIYGRGPLLQALPDIKTLNKTKELLLNAASIGIFGMYTVADDGVINIENIKLGPGSMIPVSDNPGSVRGPTLAPLQTSSDINLSQIVIDDLTNSINQAMFADPLGPIDSPVKTATEISLRQQELSKRIGSAFGKLQFELITPLINRVLDVLDEQGLIDLGPFRVDGNIIAIRHISPLAQAQKEEEITNMDRFAQSLMATFGPQVGMGLINPDVFARKLAERLNLDEGIVPTEQEFAQMKQALAQQAAQGQGPDLGQIQGGNGS